MRKNTVFLTFAASASAVHARHSTAGEAVRNRLLTAENYDTIIVTYCSNTTYPYEVRFEVTETYVIVSNPPVTIYLDKSALSNDDCQSHLHRMVKAILEA